ncbi:MAG: flavin reductase [Oscillospiraceae bacterium]
MDQKAMNSISYGLYVLTATNGNFSNGCIINTLTQVTSSPNRVSITVNKSNYTCYMIRQSGKFNVSFIDETADFSLFKHFGFSTGRWEDKFYRFTSIRAENGIPYVPEHTNAYLSGKVVKEIDLGTHIMFIADVEDAKELSDKPSMTYAYYHKNVKPKPKAKNDGKVRYICTICGYIYEGELPPDFICPICKHGVADFKRMD